MKQVVCREDIKAELDMLSDMKFKIEILEGKVSMLQDRVDLLETKDRIDVGLGTPINAPTRIGDTPHSYWGEAIPDRIRSDGHFDINDDGTLTYVRDGMTEALDTNQWLTYDYDNAHLTRSSNSNTN